MLMGELTQQIIQDIWAHKLRSILALFGIVWGTVAVVVLLALGQGFYNKQMKNLGSLVDGTFEIYLGRTSKPYQGLPSERSIYVKADAIAHLAEDLPDVREASPVIITQSYLSHGSAQTQAMVSGVAPNYGAIRRWEAVAGGRFINILDNQNVRRVVFLGDKLKTTLFPQREALGQSILINGMPFTVIGVRASKNKSDSWEDYNAFIPYRTSIALWGDQTLTQFVVTANDPEQADNFKTILSHYFGQKYHFDATDKSVLNIIDYSSFRTFFVWFFRAIQGFLGLCGALTLAVGGIGIANTLFLIVRERTQEIGLRKALGAQNYQILGQVMLETIILVGTGGLLGITIAASTITLLQLLSLPAWMGKPVLSLPILIVTGFILMLIGLLAGYFPARQAANLQPVEALNAPPC